MLGYALIVSTSAISIYRLQLRRIEKSFRENYLEIPEIFFLSILFQQSAKSVGRVVGASAEDQRIRWKSH